MSKHTPGPWSLHNFDGDTYRIVDDRDMADLSYVATVHYHEDYDGETRANAKLLAAAPEMLEALKIVETRLTHLAQNSVDVVSELRLARIAIAKAGGAA